MELSYKHAIFSWRSTLYVTFVIFSHSVYILRGIFYWVILCGQAKWTLRGNLVEEEENFRVTMWQCVRCVCYLQNKFFNPWSISKSNKNVLIFNKTCAALWGRSATFPLYPHTLALGFLCVSLWCRMPDALHYLPPLNCILSWYFGSDNNKKMEIVKKNQCWSSLFLWTCVH